MHSPTLGIHIPSASAPESANRNNTGITQCFTGLTLPTVYSAQYVPQCFTLLTLLTVYMTQYGPQCFTWLTLLTVYSAQYGPQYLTGLTLPTSSSGRMQYGDLWFHPTPARTTKTLRNAISDRPVTVSTDSVKPAYTMAEPNDRPAPTQPPSGQTPQPVPPSGALPTPVQQTTRSGRRVRFPARLNL